MNDRTKVSAAIIIIGDEILSGRTRDQNTCYIASHLGAIGITLCEVRIIPDIDTWIIDTVNSLRARYDYVFTTGGIGPTHDDITADSIARAFDVPIDIDERALDMMRKRYKEEDLRGERLRMARIPAGADLIDNSISHTPGFMLDNVIVMAGIPDIMQVMLDSVLPKLRSGRPFLTMTIRVIAPESQIAASLKAVQKQFDDLTLGSYPFFENNQLGAHLVLRSTNENALTAARDMLMTKLRKDQLDPRIVEICRSRDDAGEDLSE